MSYMRHPLYAWVGAGCDCENDCNQPDHDILHLWPDGLDNRAKASESGISVRLDLFDELVVLRYEQLVNENRVEETEARALSQVGNAGADSLAKKYGQPTMADLIEESLKDFKRNDEREE